MQRDEGFLHDDPSLTKFQNVVRYMRQHPMYMPPHKWPEGMTLFLLNDKSLIGIMFFPLDRLEKISVKELFDYIDSAPTSKSQPKAEFICFIPCLDLPSSVEDQARQATSFVSQKSPQEIAQIVQYLYVNGWVVNRPIPHSQLN